MNSFAPAQHNILSIKVTYIQLQCSVWTVAMNTLVEEADFKTFSVVTYAYKSVYILCQILIQPVIQDRNFVGGTVTDVAY
jgi:hypothetical protein